LFVESIVSNVKNFDPKTLVESPFFKTEVFSRVEGVST
jgi:hypothetical protein